MTPPSTSPALTALSVAMLPEKISALFFMPASHAAVAGSPLSCEHRATMAWKSALRPGARPSGPSTRALQIHDRLRQLGLGQLGLVVGEHRGAGGDARSTCRSAGRYCAGTCARVAGVDVGEQPGLLDGGHRGRVLGQEDVGGRRGALGDELVAELGVAALAVGHLDAGLLGEGVDPLLGQRLVLGVVDQQPVGLAR